MFSIDMGGKRSFDGTITLIWKFRFVWLNSTKMLLAGRKDMYGGVTVDLRTVKTDITADAFESDLKGIRGCGGFVFVFCFLFN